jgi:hypothetical protein
MPTRYSEIVNNWVNRVNEPQRSDFPAGNQGNLPYRQAKGNWEQRRDNADIAVTKLADLTDPQRWPQFNQWTMPMYGANNIYANNAELFFNDFGYPENARTIIASYVSVPTLGDPFLALPTSTQTELASKLGFTWADFVEFMEITAD